MTRKIFLYACLSFSITILAPKVESFDYNKSKPEKINDSVTHSEFENHLKDKYKASKDQKKALDDQNKALDDQNKVLADSSLSKKEKTKKIQTTQKQIDDTQQRLADAQQRLDDAQQKAREEYEQRHNNGLSTGEFVDQNINQNHAFSIYGEDKDTTLQQLSADLFNINPHLFKEYSNKLYSTKPKLKELTPSDFLKFEKNPELLALGIQDVPQEGEYLRRRLRLTPLEESIELKNKESINKILEMAQNPSLQEKAKNEGFDISLRSLTQPLIDKYIDILHKEGIDGANKYIESIESLDVPELTKSINRQTAMLYLQWSLADGDIETAKNILSHIRNLKIKTSFIADELTKRYDYLKKYKGQKAANSFAAKIQKLGDAKLNTEFGL